MHKITLGVGIALAVCLVGCNHLPWKRNVEPEVNSVSSRTTATPESLIRYLNDNAKSVESLRSPDVALDIRGDNNVGLNATLSCMKPNFFRLRAKSSVGGLEADFGSNDKEFWYYIKRDDPPYVYYCPHEALKDGKVKLPIPFQPEMVLAALGMATYNPDGKYEVNQVGGKIELIETAVSPEGQPIQRVVRFDARPKNHLGANPRVTAHILRDKNGKEIFTASILAVQKIGDDAEVPTHFKIAWPAQKMEMTMRLYDTKVNGIDASNTGQLFSWRESFDGHKAVNLAQLGNTKPTAIQRTGGALR